MMNQLGKVCMMSRAMLKRYNVHLDPEDLRGLQELVQEVHLPVSQQIRCAIRWYLDRHRSQRKAERKRVTARKRP
jgi:ribosomal protein S17E